MGKNNNKGGNNKGGSNKGNGGAAPSGDSGKIVETTTALMQRTIDAMQKDFAAVRTGKASPAMVDGIMVECYGTQTRLKDMAAITAPEALLLVIQPYDQSIVKNVEKAILASNLGISPVSDGRVIRLPVPELSSERRADLTKIIKKRSEDAKVEIRNARRDSNEAIKKAQKASDITEDEAKAMTDKIQKLTDKMIDAVTAATDAKIAELERI